MQKTDLSSYNNSFYNPKGGLVKRTLWYFTNHMIFNHGLLPFNFIKVIMLKLFGAKIGKGVHIKPSVNIKYPWHLELGNHVWIGEKVWIDNLTLVKVENNVCISQGAMLLTGNHNYKIPTFDLRVEEIVLGEGVWIGANAIVCPGIKCNSHSVLTVNSVATRNLDAFGIYQGNPAIKVKNRIIAEESHISPQKPG